MNTEIIVPENEKHWLELRSHNLNSTDIPALFGLSPYSTLFELWHRHKGNVVVNFEENARTLWGKRLEASIAEGIAADHGWSVRPMKEYIQEPSLRIGSSFDYSIEGYTVDDSSFMEPSPPKGILEIKNVDGLIFKNNWLKGEDGELEAPPHIELQIQTQMLVSNRSFAYIGALVGGNDIKLIHRNADQEIQFQIIAAVKAFWSSIDENREPTPDFKSDAETISKIYNVADPNKVIDTSGSQEIYSLVKQYKIVSEQLKEFEKQKQGIKAHLLTIMKDAEKVKSVDGYSISAGMIGPCVMNYERSGYRDFRINVKKGFLDGITS